MFPLQKRFGGWVRLVASLLTVSLGCSCGVRARAVAQPGPAAHGSWADVVRLSPASALDVTRYNGAVTHGSLMSATPDELRLELASGEVLTLPASDVAAVVALTRKGDRLHNGALIGAVVGVVYVLGVLAYLSSTEGGEPSAGNWVTGPLVGAGIGAAVGALIDRARKGTQKVLVYSAHRGSR